MHTAILQVAPRGAVFHVLIDVAPLKGVTLDDGFLGYLVFHVLIDVAPLKALPSPTK
jgi:hypothetical protein